MKLKANLKKILNEKDMTAAQLSRLSGVPKSTISEWLAGGMPRDLNKLKVVAEKLQVSVDGLCFSDNPLVKPSSAIKEYANEINAGLFEVVLRKVHQKT